MSNQELDHLFKNKLEDLKREPSADAWSKIQASTNKKTSHVVWFYMRIAAAVILLATIGGILWVNQVSEANTTLVADNEEIKKLENTANDAKTDRPDKTKEPQINGNKGLNEDSPWVKEDQKDKKNEKAGLKRETTETQTIETLAKPVQKITKEEKNDDMEIRTLEPAGVQYAEAIPKEELKINEVDATIKTAIASTNQQPDKGSTLVFNIEDFNKQSIASDELQNKDDKKSTLKKIMEFTKEIKDNAGLGELREAKNDLLALNFKKDDNDDTK